MTVTVEGVSQTQKNLLKTNELLNGAITRSVKLVSEEVKREAVFRIRETSFGKVVTKYDEGGPYTHVVSLPGEAPNNDTGNLVRSIRTTFAAGGLVGFVYTDVDYGFYLETVLNRPWLNPALQAKQPLLRSVLTKNMGEAIKRAAV